MSCIPRTILDLGANIGLAAIFFSRCFSGAQVACVEPEPGNIDALRANLRFNGVEAAVFPVAVSVKGGTERLFIHEKDYGHTLVSENVAAGAKEIAVRSMTIPEIIDELGWTRVGLLKVDIEGYEKYLFAANCDWLWLVDNIIIEWHEDVDPSQAALQEVAVRYGFEPPQLLPGGWSLTRPGIH